MTALKPARVDHNRCQEIDGRTWFLIPADWTWDQFNAAVDATKDDYQAAIDEAMKEAGPRPEHFDTWLDRIPADMDSLTVAEAKAKAAEQLAQERAWSERRRTLGRGFAEFAEPHGLIPLYNAYSDGDDLGVFETELYWGHQHGTPLQYDDNETLDHSPLKPLAALADRLREFSRIVPRNEQRIFDTIREAADRIEFLEGCLAELADWESTKGISDPYVNGYDVAREDVADQAARALKGRA